MSFQLSTNLHAYVRLRDRILAANDGIDDATLADTLEGATELHEAVAAVVRSALTDEALVAGLKDYIQNLEARLHRLKERAVLSRQIARDAMVEADLPKIAAPDCTISLRSGSPSVVLLDEKAVPTNYWVVPPPKLDRLALLADLKRGTEIPGAQLSAPEQVLSVRVK